MNFGKRCIVHVLHGHGHQWTASVVIFRFRERLLDMSNPTRYSASLCKNNKYHCEQRDKTIGLQVCCDM